ncbi:MAG: protein kinase [Sandaracinaceae bacterium]
MSSKAEDQARLCEGPSRTRVAFSKRAPRAALYPRAARPVSCAGPKSLGRRILPIWVALLSDALDLPKPFGAYTLLRRLAVGGMAEVYVASTKGIGGFEKLVAIKVIHPRFSEDDHFIQMLVEEAKIAVQLNHVNIAQTFDLGCVENTYYIAMEFVEGADTYRIQKRSKNKLQLPVDVCCYIASEVLNGLEYAHRKRDGNGQPLSIVHRDISPQNVLVSYSGEVKLVDFGIAKAASRNGQTEVGVIKGKYYYMSPEQAWGDPVDHRTDIFATGILLTELLTGQMVYQEDNVPALLDKVRKADIPSPRLLRHDLPEELVGLIARATAREMEDRYASAQAFSQELSRFLYSRNPTFTASKVVDMMATLFPTEVKRHSQVLRLPNAESPAAASFPAPSKPLRAPTPSAPVAPPVPAGRSPLSSQDFRPAAAADSLIFDLAAVGNDSTRNDILPFRSPADPTKKLQQRARHEPWDEETFLKSRKDEWEDATNIDEGGQAMAAIIRAAEQAVKGAELESDRTVASASFPDLLEAPIAAPPRRQSKALPPSRPPVRERRPPPPPSHALASRPMAAPAPRRGMPESARGSHPDLAIRPELEGEATHAYPPSMQSGTGHPSHPGRASHPGHGHPGSAGPSAAMRLGPAADRAFAQSAADVYPFGSPPPPMPPQPMNASSLPADPFAPLGGPAPAFAVGPPPADPFAAQPPPAGITGTEADLGKPQPLKWLALGGVTALVLLLIGVLGWVLVSGEDPASLEVISVPEGASVQMGGEALGGRTPILLDDLTPGDEVVLHIERDGYEPADATFSLVEGENRRVFLLNQVRVSLRIRSDPPGAQVWVDEELRGTTPLTLSGLPAGRDVSLRASAPGHGEVRQVVSVDESDRAPEVLLELPPAAR